MRIDSIDQNSFSARDSNLQLSSSIKNDIVGKVHEMWGTLNQSLNSYSGYYPQNISYQVSPMMSGLEKWRNIDYMDVYIFDGNIIRALREIESSSLTDLDTKQFIRIDREKSVAYTRRGSDIPEKLKKEKLIIEGLELLLEEMDEEEDRSFDQFLLNYTGNLQMQFATSQNKETKEANSEEKRSYSSRDALKINSELDRESSIKNNQKQRLSLELGHSERTGSDKQAEKKKILQEEIQKEELDKARLQKLNQKQHVKENAIESIRKVDHTVTQETVQSDLFHTQIDLTQKQT